MFRVSPIALCGAVFIFFMATTPARAAFVLITWGEGITDLHDLAPGERTDFSSKGRVGFKYRYFGMFWVNFWTYKGEFCVYEGDRYVLLTQEKAAQSAGVPARSLSAPFFYTYPLGWVLLAAVVVFVLAFGVLVLIGEWLGSDGKISNSNADRSVALAAAPAERPLLPLARLQKFRVTGIDIESGFDTALVVEAVSVIQAGVIGEEWGITVSRIEILPLGDEKVLGMF